MTRRFVVPRRVRQAMVAHAARDLPLECCGLLVGREAMVTDAVPMSNVEKSAIRFRIDPAEHIALRRTLRHSAPPLEIVGVYHSHPDGPARPSPSDVAEACYPDWLYVVVGLAGGKVRVRGFIPASGRMRPARLAGVG